MLILLCALFFLKGSNTPFCLFVYFYFECDALTPGVCNGDPSDDLKMQNRTIITNMEEIEMFIKSWAIEKSHDVTTRRPVRNCTEDNCTYCIELLNRSVFIPCHKKVSTIFKEIPGAN